MMAEERIEEVLRFLEQHGIDYEIHRHPPLPTIDIALEYWKDIEALHCKNLFFRNHKGNRHYLVSFECHKELDIHSLEHLLRQGKQSFASPERMMRCLGLCPGSVSPLGLIHDIGLCEHPAVVAPDGSRDFGALAEGVDARELFDDGHRVRFFADSAIRTAEKVSFHPCDNTASVVLGGEDFRRFLAIWGGGFEWLDV